MRAQIIMDNRGDTRHEFDPTSAEAVDIAAKRFRTLTDAGYRAVALGKDGAPGVLLRDFNPSVEQTLFIPQLQGG